MNEEPVKVVDLFTRAKVTVVVDQADGVSIVTMIDDESLKLALHIVEMIRLGDLIGLAIVGVNPKGDVPVIACCDSLPKLYQETLRLFALELIKEGMTDNIHDRIEFKDRATPEAENAEDPEEPEVE